MEKDAIMEPDVWGLCQEFITHGDKADQVHRLIHYLSKGYTGYVEEACVTIYDKCTIYCLDRTCKVLSVYVGSLLSAKYTIYYILYTIYYILYTIYIVDWYTV